MSIPELPDELMDKLTAWHESRTSLSECVADNEGQGCCLDNLLIAHMGRKNLTLTEIGFVANCTTNYVKSVLVAEEIEVKE